MSMPQTFLDSFDYLHGMASEKTGLSDFGDDLYHEPLRTVLAAIDFDHGQNLAPEGRTALTGMLVDVLCERLHTERGWKANPQYREVAIRRPVIITGLPRTGSTALHRLLSIDDQFQGVPYWIYRQPQPRPERETWEATPAYQESVAGLAMARQMAPDLFAAHDVSADEVDECYYGLRQSFCDPFFTSAMSLPTYADWFSSQDATFSFQRYADLLRLVGLATPERTWLLKNPSHLYSMEALFASFPDACIIQTHRHPFPVIASIASLVAASHRMIFGKVSKKRLGAELMQRLHGAVTHGDRIRQQHKTQYFDMHQSDLKTNGMETVHAIYEHFGLTLVPETAARMEQWLKHQPTEQKGGHIYDPADFGLDIALIEEYFSNYIERYCISR